MQGQTRALKITTHPSVDMMPAAAARVNESGDTAETHRQHTRRIEMLHVLK
jgi:hypothetical protein